METNYSRQYCEYGYAYELKNSFSDYRVFFNSSGNYRHIGFKHN